MLEGKVELLYIRIRSFRVFEDIDDRVSSQEHFWNKASFRHRCPLLALLRDLSPDLLDIFHHHIHMPIKGFDLSHELFVVS